MDEVAKKPTKRRARKADGIVCVLDFGAIISLLTML